MKNTGFGYLHYTMSMWATEEDLKNFAHSGAHLSAMKQSRTIAHEIRIYTFQSSQLPTWKEAKRLLQQNGRILTYKPSKELE